MVFISGNMPMKTEIVPLLIIPKLEQYDYAAATAVAHELETQVWSIGQGWIGQRLGR